MELTVWMYLTYLLASVLLTIWVAHTLHKNGRAFLVEAFGGDVSMADSVNHLLVVGFYLINFGYATLALKSTSRPGDLAELIEAFSTKIGLVLLVLGFMHFTNLFIFSRMRRRTQGPETS